MKKFSIQIGRIKSRVAKKGIRMKIWVERKERSHRLIVKGAEFEKAFPLSKDLEQEDVQKVMSQLKISS